MPKTAKDLEDYLRKLKHDYEEVFALPAGTRVLEDIRKSGMVDRRIFNESIAVMAHNEGRRNLALHIIEMATPESETARPLEAVK